MTRIIAIIVGGSVMCVTLSGCGADDGTPGTPSAKSTSAQIEDAAKVAQEQGLDAQYELLKDGEASKSDYQEAFAQQLSCMTEKSLVPGEPFINRVDGLTLLVAVDYGSIDMDEGSKLQAGCYEKFLGIVEQAYLGSHAPQMNGPLLTSVTTCLSEKSIEVSTDVANLPDIRSSAGKANESAVNECLQQSASALYPGETIAIPG